MLDYSKPASFNQKKKKIFLRSLDSQPDQWYTFNSWEEAVKFMGKSGGWSIKEGEEFKSEWIEEELFRFIL